MNGTTALILNAILGIDTSEYDDGLTGAEKKQSAFAAKAKKAFAVVGKATLAATGVAIAGVAKLSKSAVAGFADYEQLVGGVETLFGTGGMTLEEYAEKVGKTVDEAADDYNRLSEAQELVLSNADKAYKTAGLSANDYMETVTSFSAALINSLEGDTTKAAEYADMAIIDMADNANKMGSSMESIQNAYSGFAKQNYTMLDNLKLGYGGTKEEMERLLETASELSGIDYDIESYADIVSAIHVIQESMGISGTTAKEAEQTVTGSLNSMKAAWENLIVSMGKNGEEVGPLVEKFSQTLTTFLGNLIPVIRNSITNISTLIQEIGPKIVELLPQLVSDVLPPLLAAVTSILLAIGDVLPGLIDTIIAILPQVIDAGVTLIFALMDGLTKAAPDLLSKISDVLILLIDKLTEPDTLTQLIIGGIELLMAIVEGFTRATPKLIEKVPTITLNIVRALVQNGDKMWDAAKALIAALWDGMKATIKTYNNLYETYIIRPIKEGISKGISTIREVGKNLIEGLWNGIKDKTEWLKSKIKGFTDGVMDTIKNFFGIHSPSKEMAKVGVFMAQGLGIGWNDEYKDIKKQITSGLTMSMDFEAARGVLQANNSVNVNNTVELTGDMAKLFKAIVRENNQNTMSTGRNALAW